MRSMFVPPNARARANAIGKLDSLDPILQRAFDPAGPFFEPIETPNDNDWLANHIEKGQTYNQFLLKSSRVMPSANQRVICLQPLGNFAETTPVDLLPKLGEFAGAFFSLPVRVLDPIPLEGLSIRSRLIGKEKRLQLLTTDVLSWLRTRILSHNNVATRDAYCLLAVTMVDLYPDPTWNFVFGQASLRDRVGVYSFARYDPLFYGDAMETDDQTSKDRDSLILKRSCKVLAHETGHIFGMQHCVYYRCIMNGSNHLGESDSRPLHLCPVCLRKLHSACGFHVLERYASLKRFADSVGWMDESAWLTARLQWLSR